MSLSTVRTLMTFMILLAGLTSCQVGKKPVRKNVRIDRYAIKQRYGMNTVDTIVFTKEVNKDSSGNAESTEEKKELTATLLQLSQSVIPFNTFSGKAKMHYATGDDKQEFVAHFRISRDKIIWINVTALSGVVSVARVYITPDSIFLVNYLQKEAHKLQMKDISKLLPVAVDFATMQNLILGNVLRLGGKVVDVGDFGGTWAMQVKDTQAVQQLAFNKADSTIRTLQLRTNDDSTQGMMQYGAYEMIDNRRFSDQRVITINNAGQSHYIDMNFNKVEFDQPVDFPFTIPKNYELK